MDPILREALVKIKENKFTNTFKESVIKDPEFGEGHWNTLVESALSNAMCQRIMKEGKFSDMANVLGVMHDVVLDAATKMATRELCWIVPTTAPLIRFFLRTRSKRWRMHEGPSLVTPGKHTYVDVTVDEEWGTDALFSKSYLEDAPYDVVKKEIEESAQLLEEGLTTDILTMYDAVAEANLAGGANIDVATNGTLAWVDLVKARQTLRKAGGMKGGKTILAVHPDEVADLFNDDKFIHGFYFGDKFDVARGVLGGTYLGFTIVETDLFPTADYAYLIDTARAAAVALRRDIIPEPYKEKTSEGIINTMRYGMKALSPSTGLVRIDISP